MPERFILFITCPRGVEDLLLAECAAQGLSRVEKVTAGVQGEGNLEQAYRLCLWSRVASRVLLRVDRFAVSDEDSLYRGIRRHDWSRHLDVDGSLAVDVKSTHSRLNDTRFAALKVKDAVVDQFREQYGARPGIDRETPDIRINLYVSQSEAIVYLDLSGSALHQRGYRRGTGVAPLKENLAAAILLRSRWPEHAVAGRPLLDPMCGAGTLLIEAAMIATRTAPAIGRSYFGFLGWKQHDPDLWQRLREEAMQARQTAHPSRISGIEKSFKVVNMARDNVYAAGFESMIEIIQGDSLSAYRPGDVTGLVVTNPPYGKRLGVSAELRQLYLDLGRTLKQNLPGWDVSLFTGNHELARFFGLRAHRRNVLYNGALKCTLYQYRLREMPAQALQASGDSEREMFANRLAKNMRHLKKWAARAGVTCYRLYDADIPQYSAAVDVFGDWVRVQEYAAPGRVNQVRAFIRLNDIVATVAEVTGVPADHVIVKQRRRQSGSRQYERESMIDQRQTVEENGLRFSVNLHDYLDTGLFTDHRITRQLIRRLSRGKSFLNLFAYTGTATVYAAAGGATRTRTVDMSKTYLEWARGNMALNGFREGDHRYIQADCLQWLESSAAIQGGPYDIIFLDPPTFSNSKRMERTLDIKRDHVELIRRVLNLLGESGLLLFSSNARGFRLDIDALQDLAMKDITRQTTPEDYRRKPLHVCWAICRHTDGLKAVSGALSDGG